MKRTTSDIRVLKCTSLELCPKRMIAKANNDNDELDILSVQVQCYRCSVRRSSHDIACMFCYREDSSNVSLRTSSCKVSRTLECRSSRTPLFHFTDPTNFAALDYLP